MPSHFRVPWGSLNSSPLVYPQLQQRLNLLRQLEEEEEEMRRQLIFDAKVDMLRFDV